MAIRKTLNFLPEVFKTSTNKKFLAATLDQLVSEPDLSRINGFIGRKFSPAYTPTDNYLIELTTARQNYQLEPSVVVKNADNTIAHYSDYMDLVDQIGHYGGVTDNHDRLFKSEYYSFDPKIDLDKFVNFSQYYWLSDGPTPVMVTAGITYASPNFAVTRNTGNYTTDQTGSVTNPEITLVRGVPYTFIINQTGSNFWIQTEPGISGYKEYNPEVSSRDIQGVTNNGIHTGTIAVTIPSKTAQDYYFKMPFLDFIDYATTASFSSLDGQSWNTGPGSVLSIDGATTFPNDKYVVFLGDPTINPNWVSSTSATIPLSQRQGLWQITVNSDSVINLVYVRDIPVGYKIRIDFGSTRAGSEYFKDTNGLLTAAPSITAPLSTLYYQDSAVPARFGVIKIVDAPSLSVNIDTDIVGNPTYTSPNGIVFTNGLAVTFDSTVTSNVPHSYENKTYIVEGVGTAIKLVSFADLVDNTPENARPWTSIPFDILGYDIDTYDQPVRSALLPEYILINRSAADYNSWSSSNRWFHIDIILKSAEYNKTTPILDQTLRAQRPIIEFIADLKLFENQTKLFINQAPLFDILDAAGESLGNLSKYVGSSFTGSKLFSYKSGTGYVDSVLGFALDYLNVGNSIGDINFENNFSIDTFSYTNNETKARINGSIVTGFLSNVASDAKFDVWNTVNTLSKQYQVISSAYTDNRYFVIDVVPVQNPVTSVNDMKVFVNNKLITGGSYTVEAIGVRHYVHIPSYDLVSGDKIDILIYSNQVSDMGYYQIPTNLDFNSKNAPMEYVTLGQMRNHLMHIGNNTVELTGDILANSNVRDLNVTHTAGSILQQSAPTINSSLFLIDPQANFVNSLDFSRREYTKFKNKFLELCLSLYELDPANPSVGVDTILSTINAVKNSSFPWFYSDMVPYGDDYIQTDTAMINGDSLVTRICRSTRIHANLQLSNQAILVYHTPYVAFGKSTTTLLVVGRDYTLSQTQSTLTITAAVDLNQNDVITVKEYTNTDSNYIPETPTKLGLYPKYLPEIFVDDTYQTSISVIQGHDGSITPAFNDIRDIYLLELECRIYNNIKVDSTLSTTTLFSTVPGRFRTTDYSRTEFDQVLNSQFLKWIGSTQVDYSSNTYFTSNDQFSWNYNKSFDSISGQVLPGYWRGIYNYFYDTDRPHTHPWEMLGFTETPTWWVSAYGAAPYLSTNTMWADLEAGYISGTATTDTNYARPNLSKMIPVDAAGNLVSPQLHIAAKFNSNTLSGAYAVGDQGPVESAWRRTSEFPFAMQNAFALTRPAFYFGTLADTTRYARSAITGQYVLTGTNKKISPTAIQLNGESVSGSITRATGYINWIIDYLTSLGINGTTKVRGLLSNVDVILSHKMASYTDKKFLTVLADQFSPSSTNQSVILPDENYMVHLNKGVPIRTSVYSAVIVEKTLTGYTVSGYDIKSPYFTIVPSETAGKSFTITVMNTSAVIFNNYRNQKINIPYGFEFRNKQQVVDFLVSYQRFLIAQGFVFSDYNTELAHNADWVLSAKEFLTWSLQGWKTGSVLVLSPVNTSLTLISDDSVVDAINNRIYESRVLGPNFEVIRTSDILIGRDSGTTTLNTISGQTIAFAELILVQYEHVLLFDNVTVFNDIIYKPELGNRQYRLRLIGAKTNGWTGALDPGGFIYNNATIDAWSASKDYLKADIVQYKNNTYSATRDISGSDTFNFNHWSILVRDLNTGMLPNFANNATKLADVYDIDNQPLDETFDKFSNGLIGYRNRAYLEDLGMNQTSQSKFYQGYVKAKGTKDAINAISKAQFDNLASSITTYEEWAVRVGEYGAIDSNLGIDISLSAAKYKNNPSVIVLLNETETAPILVNAVRPVDLVSKPLSYTPNIFLNRDAASDYENDINSAGYVNISDVDSLLFDMQYYATLDADLSLLETGYKIWVAKDFDADWQVYKINQTPVVVVQIDYALDNKIKITTQTAHGLTASDIFAFTGLDADLDGFYQVLIAEDTTSMIVVVSQTLLDSTSIKQQSITGTGVLFELQRTRFKQLSTLTSYSPVYPWNAQDLAWVDDTGNGTWAVYEYSGSQWNAIRHQAPIVDIASINGMYLYDSTTKELMTRLDFIDPIKGKILGVAKADLDFISSFDPAKYNTGTSIDLPIDLEFHWGKQQLATIWWDVDAVRYFSYEQDSIAYRASYWGRAFPGSSINVYEWVGTDVLPSGYVDAGYDGIPLYQDDSAYVASTYVDTVTGVINNEYYYWVRGKQSKASLIKANSVLSIEHMIRDPSLQGIPYAEVLKDNSIALYNIGEYLAGETAVLHIDYQTSVNQNIAHAEFGLIQEGNAKSTMYPRIAKKLIDSIVGADIELSLVPDQSLTAVDKMGLGLRPRQTLIIDRLKAVENIVTYINSILIQFSISDRIVNDYRIYSDNFYAMDPTPAMSEYDEVVLTMTELGYVNKTGKSTGYKVLVQSDNTSGGFWAIYKLDSARNFVLHRVQTFDVTKFWNFVDWYATGFSIKTKLNYTVKYSRDILKLSLVVGDVVKVLDNGAGLFEVYQYTSSNSKTLIGLQKGTIQLSDSLWDEIGFDSDAFDSRSFDYTGFIELRYILQGLQQDILVDDLEIYYDNLLFYVIEYILAEQKTVDWIFKTSFISVLHTVAGLVKSPVYVKDRQEFYRSYVDEVKPYRTKIQEYLLSYTNLEATHSAVSDFDLPAYYDMDLAVFRSPSGEYPVKDQALLAGESQYQDWANNYTYSVDSILLVSGGYGYNVPPDISIISSDDNGVDASAQAVIKPTSGSILQVLVDNPGTGYTATPIIAINGNGLTSVTSTNSKTFKVISRGLSDTTFATAAGLYNGNTDELIYASAIRSYTMHRIRRFDGTLTFSQSYDVYGLGETTEGRNAATLAQDLNDTTNEYIVIISTYDEPQAHRLDSGLAAAMYRCGAGATLFGYDPDPLLGEPMLKFRSAYILAGIPGIGEGRGLEIYSGIVDNSTEAACELDFSIPAGQLQINRVVPATAYSASGRFDSFGFDGLFDDDAANVTDTSYRELLAPAVVRWAQVTPRIVNNTIRKLKTIVKFDRIQYTSDVVDWAENVAYARGSIVSYMGEGYRSINAVPASLKFNATLFARLAEKSFTNANDRIMALYEPTSLMVPKVLGQLIYGISSNDQANNTVVVDPDTVITGGAFSNVDGIAPESIILSGGTFAHELFAYAPEELMPGTMMESLSIKVLTTSASHTGFRMFMDINFDNNNNRTYTSISPANTTTLATDLFITDTSITVTDGNALPTPNVSALLPGVIYVGGERIEYYVKSGPVLSQLKRGYGGTSALTLHRAGSIVEDMSVRSVIAELE